MPQEVFAGVAEDCIYILNTKNRAPTTKEFKIILDMSKIDYNRRSRSGLGWVVRYWRDIRTGLREKADKNKGVVISVLSGVVLTVFAAISLIIKKLWDIFIGVNM